MTASNEHTIDYKQPLASVLKAATAVAHESAEHSQGASWLTRGELDKDEYVRFLMMLWHVYRYACFRSNFIDVSVLTSGIATFSLNIAPVPWRPRSINIVHILCSHRRTTRHYSHVFRRLSRILPIYLMYPRTPGANTQSMWSYLIDRLLLSVPMLSASGGFPMMKTLRHCLHTHMCAILVI